jgi:hypothetical protein
MEDMYHIYHIQFKDELLGQDFGAVCHWDSWCPLSMEWY